MIVWFLGFFFWGCSTKDNLWNITHLAKFKLIFEQSKLNAMFWHFKKFEKENQTISEHFPTNVSVELNVFQLEGNHFQRAHCSESGCQPICINHLPKYTNPLDQNPKHFPKPRAASALAATAPLPANSCVFKQRWEAEGRRQGTSQVQLSTSASLSFTNEGSSCRMEAPRGAARDHRLALLLATN